MSKEYANIKRLLERDGLFMRDLKKGLILIVDLERELQVAALKFNSREELTKGMKEFFKKWIKEKP